MDRFLKKLKKLAQPALLRRAASVVLVVALMLTMVGAVVSAGGTIRLSNGSGLPAGNTTLAPVRRTAFVSNDTLIRIRAVSMELDLDIMILDMAGAQVTGQPFEIVVSASEGGQEVARLVDEDMDGSVYIDEIPEGEYMVSVSPMDDLETPNPVLVEVEPKIIYEKQDVSDLIVSESDVDVSKEDNQYGDSSGGGADSGSGNDTVKDTVEFVESRTETSSQEVSKPVLDENGNQVVKYKPQSLAEGNYLLDSAGNATKYYVTLDESGYVTSIKYRNSVGGEEQPPGTVEQPPATEEAPEAAEMDGWAEVIGADGSVLGGVRLERIALTTTETVTTTTYYGWQENYTYYYDKNGVKVTGVQIIQGVTYVFGSDGKRGSTGSGNTIGIDVSTYQDNINWQRVKAAGIEYAFIRVGFRGYGSGALVEDSMFRTNIQQATAAGIKVGVYFFSQAVNEAEAIQEASMCLQLVAGYNIQYPIAIDVEYATSSLNGRADRLTRDERTRVCIAFCETIRNAGYIPAVYANKDFFTNKLYASSLSSYIIWLAHYTGSINTPSSYTGRYDIWQYSSRGSVDGISTYVDMNVSYLSW